MLEPSNYREVFVASTTTVFGVTETRWLDETQQQAWQALLVFFRRGVPALERTFKAHDLLVVHFSILVALSEAPEKTLGLSELADFANVSQSRLTHRLRTLIERGEVVIEPDPIDKRAKNATLTAAGQDRLDLVTPTHAEDVQQLFFDHLDPHETEVLAGALAKVARSLCAHEQFGRGEVLGE